MKTNLNEARIKIANCRCITNDDANFDLLRRSSVLIVLTAAINSLNTHILVWMHVCMYVCI